MGGLDTLAVDDEVLTINLKGSLPASVHGVVLELVSHVVGIGTGVDGHEGGVGVLNHDTGNKTTDTAEAVDAEAIAH